MAQRKPTDITIAAPANPLVGILNEPRIWVPIVAVVLAVTAFILGRQYMAVSGRKAIDADWATFAEATEVDPSTYAPQGEPAELASLVNRLDGSEVAAWARLVEIAERLEQWDEDGAAAALEELRASHPKSMLVQQAFPFDSGEMSIADNLAQFIESQRRWGTANPQLFGAPTPENAPRVQLTTTEGDITIALLREEAPGTTASFLQLTNQGFFDGTLFHAVDGDMRVVGGDPHTREGEKGPEFWGSGGRGHGAPGEANRLKLFEGVVVTDLPNDPDEPCSSRFAILAGDGHRWNGRCTVFGVVVEGLDVVRRIAARPRVEGSNQPQDPVQLEAAKLL